MSSSRPTRPVRVPVTLSLALLVLAVLIKLVFVAHLGGRVYPDVLKIVNYGALVANGTFAIRTDMINDKTFVGPLLWWPAYAHAGVPGLLTINFVAFLGLCAVHYGLARRRYGSAARLIAFVLFAFYVGTHRNIVAGEPDDNVSALLLGLGILLYLDTRRVFVAAMCIGIAFLFKFSAAIFGGGLALYLAWKRTWRELGWALLGMGLPFLALNLVDGLASLHSLVVSLQIQHGYSTWGSLGLKFLSTGLAPMVVITTWAWWKQRDDDATLFWLLSMTYPLYALLNRDAFAATFVMMTSLLSASFLVAEAMLDAVERCPRPWRLPIIIGTLTAYVVLTTAATHLNLFRDTTPMVLVNSPPAMREMFPYNDGFESTANRPMKD